MWLCSSSMSIIEDRDPSVHLDILTVAGRGRFVSLHQLVERGSSVRPEFSVMTGPAAVGGAVYQDLVCRGQFVQQYLSKAAL